MNQMETIKIDIEMNTSKEFKLKDIIDFNDLNTLRTIRGFLEISNESEFGLNSDNLTLFITNLLENSGIHNIDFGKTGELSYRLINRMDETTDLNKFSEILSSINLKDLVLEQNFNPIKNDIMAERLIKPTNLTKNELLLIFKKIKINDIVSFKQDVYQSSADYKFYETFKLKYEGFFNFNKTIEFERNNKVNYVEKTVRHTITSEIFNLNLILKAFDIPKEQI